MLPALKLRHLTLGLAQSGRSGKALVDGLPVPLAAQAKLRLVPGIFRLSTVATRFSAAAHAGGNGTRSEIAQTEELLKELSAFQLQIGERFRHKAFWHIGAPTILESYYSQKYDPKKKNPPLTILISHTHAPRCTTLHLLPAY